MVLKYFKRMRSENIKLNMCRNRVWHTCFILRIKVKKTKTSKLRKKRSTQLLRECWSFLKKLMTCQNLQNKLLNITVLFIWYLLASLKKMSLAKHGEFYFIFGEYLFQSTHHFGECLKKMVYHTMHVCKEDSPTMIFSVIKKTSENNLHYVEGFPEEKIILTLWIWHTLIWQSASGFVDTKCMDRISINNKNNLS